MSLTVSTSPPGNIFKAYDIRGVVGKGFDTDAAYFIGRALGSEAVTQGEQQIFCGRDGRLSSLALQQALIRGLRDSGMDVLDLGCVPTPVVYFAAATGCGSCAMVTGSHNPPKYNGIKMVLGGLSLTPERIQALRARIEAGDYTTGAGSYQLRDVQQSYLDRITSDVTLARPMRVAVDCGNGAASELAPRLLKALGCEFDALYCEINGHFPAHHPDPSQPENLQDLIALMATAKYDLGLAFDGDGDRLGVVSASGEIIWADRLMMLYARDILSRHPGAEIIYDIKCTANLGRSIARDGGRPVMFRTGHSMLKTELKRSGALLAGELSGHIFFAERWYGFDDALYTMARLLEILAKDARSPAEIFAALPNMINTPELFLHMREGEHFGFMEQLLASASFEGAEVTLLDGIRADFADGWGLVRASNTTPSLGLRFEAETPQALARIQQCFRRQMLAVEPDLILPF